MGGGGSQPSTTTQTTRPFPGQEKALKRLFTTAESDYALGPQQYFPSDTVAAQSDNTIAGQNLALDTIAPSASMGFNSAGAINAALDPTSAQSQALMAPFLAQLQGQILPSIGSSAIQQGAFGGDRQRIQEQMAAEGVAGQMTDAFLRNSLNAINAIPTANRALLQPSVTASAVGAQQEAREQALIDAEKARFDFEQQAPQTALDRLASRITGVNIGGTTTTNVNTGSSGFGNTLGTVAGAGLTAKGLGII